MATKITESKPVTREVNIQGMDCAVTIDPTGVSIYRKGDRHREKRCLVLGWDELMDSAGPEPDPNDWDDFEPLSYLNYEDE